MGSGLKIDAVYNNNINNVRTLLNQGVYVNCHNHLGQSPLHAAAFVGNLEIVKLLIDNGANIREMSGGHHTPLQLSAGQCHLDVVKFLLDHGAPIDALDFSRNWTALNYAIWGGCKEVVLYFLEKGADTGNAAQYNGKYYKLYQFALAEKQFEIAETLKPYR